MPVSSAISGADTAFLPLQRTGSRPLSGPGGDGEAAFRDLLPGAAPSAPAAAVPPAATFEGSDALAQLRQDLLSGASVIEPVAAAVPADGPYLSAPPVSPADPAMPAVADPVLPPDPAAAPEAAEGAGEDRRRVSWRNDEFKGRRLADDPVAGADDGGWLFGEDGFTFGDLVDVINPLQHLPVVSSIYRWVTGDEISPAATMAGGALFGGPLGLAGAVASVAIEEATGDDLGGHAMAMLFGEGEAGGGETPATAAAASPAIADDAAARTSLAPEALLQPEAVEPAAAPIAAVAFEAAAVEPAAAIAPEPPAGGDPAIANQMMQALQKYEALLLSRSGASAGGSLYDNSL